MDLKRIRDILVAGNESYTGDEIIEHLVKAGYTIVPVDSVAAVITEADMRDFRLQALKNATSNPTQADKSDGSTTLARAKNYLAFIIGTSHDA